jgi:hypothetical protein
MARACTVCTHPDRAALDEALAANRGPIRGLARTHGLSEDAVTRHARAHLPKVLALAARAAEETRGGDLLDKVKQLEQDARRLLAKAEKEKDYRCAIAAVKTAIDVVSVLHRVAEDQRAVVRDVLRSPSWTRFKARLLDTLAPYPDALAAVARLAEAPPEDPAEEGPWRGGAEDRLALAMRAANILAPVLARNPEAAAALGDPSGDGPQTPMA